MEKEKRECSTCRFWSDIYEIKGNLADCCNITMWGESDNSQPYIKVRADDDQGLDAVLITNGNFCCSLYSVKIKSMEYVIPLEYAICILNDDFSGLDNKEIKVIDDFFEKNYHLADIISIDSENTEFKIENDMTKSGDNCCKVTFSVKKHY